MLSCPLFVCLVKLSKQTIMRSNILEISINALLAGINPGLEDLEDGKKRREKEYIWYGRLTNPEVLQKAAKQETQKQSTVKGKGGTIRVRETTCMGQVRYTLTGKAYSGRGDADEASTPTSKDLHEVFKAITGESMDKIRYTFPIEGTALNWEVDVFIDVNGNPKDWIKIDLEVPDVITEFPPLPVVLADMIFGANTEYTQEQKAKLDELYATVFINKL
jgi:CYTH domain-containing protein